jgi:hypothetical protein
MTLSQICEHEFVRGPKVSAAEIKRRMELEKVEEEKR